MPIYGWNTPRKSLLEETLEILEEYHKTPADIMWVGKYDGSDVGSWQSFAELAKHVDGGDAEEWLVIVGEDWWLEQYEYDSSISYWKFKEKPTWGVEHGPPEPLTMRTLTRCSYRRIEDGEG